jgi:hypothetical protein
MQNSVLISLAILKVNMDMHQGIFLDNFIPFVTDTLKCQKQDVVSIPELQKSLIESFKLCIPQHVLKALLYRAKKKNIVFLKDHVFYRNKSIVDASNFGSIQQKVQIIYGGLISDFQAFAQRKYKVSFTEQEAERIILAFISYNQLYIYQSCETDKVIQQIPTITTNDKVIISDYIIEVTQKNPQIFDYIDTIVKGYMLANMLYLSDVHSTNKKFRRTKIYLDTSFILFLLGYSGLEEQAPCLELLDLLRINNAQVYSFRHSVVEIKGILDAASSKLGAIESGTFGRSLRYFSVSGYSSSDILLLRSQLERNLSRLGINILDKPDYLNEKNIIDEEALFQFLKEKMPHNRDSAISRDVDSISAIYRLRKNESVSNVEDTAAIFVTTSITFNNAANDFYYKDHDLEFVPPCISDYMLTNLLWLKTPNQAPKLPMKRIIADSYAAIEPDSSLLIKWMNEINKLKQNSTITEEDYFFMRYSKEIQNALIEFTRGDINIITSGSVPVIIEKAKDKIREDMKVVINKETKKREQTEAEYSKLKAESERAKIISEENLISNSRAFTKPFIKIIKVFVFLFLIALIFLSLPYETLLSKNISIIISQWPSFIRPILFIILFVIVIYQTWFGTTLNSLFNRFELFIQDRTFQFLDSLSKSKS